jgi:hypothetical protein
MAPEEAAVEWLRRVCSQPPKKSKLLVPARRVELPTFALRMREFKRLPAFARVDVHHADAM